MNCLQSLIKYIVFLFNLVFLVCGVLLITLGALMLRSLGNFKEFSDSETIPIVVMSLGGLIFVISFCGCCGAIRENVCFTTIYSVCMFLLFCCQIGLCVWMFVKRSDVLKAMGDVVDKAWDENDNAHGFPMDVLQLGFNCCGKNGASDYNGSVPASCCGDVQSTTNTCDASIYNSRPGCKQEFVDFWKTNMNIIGYGSIGVAVVELAAFVLSCILLNGMRSSRGVFN